MIKKSFMMIILILNILFCLSMNVYAKYTGPSYGDSRYNAIKKELDNGERVHLCYYINTEHCDIVGVTYNANNNDWAIYYTSDADEDKFTCDGRKLVVDSGGGDHILQGSFAHIKDLPILHYRAYTKGGGSWNNLVNNFRCTPYAFMDYDYDNEICLDTDSNCGSEFNDDCDDDYDHCSGGKRALYLLEDEDYSLFYKIKKYYESDVFDDITIDDFNGNYNLDGSNIKKIIRTKTMQKTKEWLNMSSASDLSSFIYTYIDELDSYVQSAYTRFEFRFKSIINEKITKGELTQEQGNAIVGATKNYSTQANVVQSFVTHPNRMEIIDDFTSNCEDFAHGIQVGGYIILFISIIIPFAIILKSSISVMSIITSGKSEEFKKMFKKLGFSLLSAIVIFVVPSTIHALFNIVERYSNLVNDDSKICAACLFDPFDSSCTDYVNK